MIIIKKRREHSKVNLNHASFEELIRLPGIGRVIAKRIIDYREQQGPFRDVEELILHIGLRENWFNQIRHRVTI